MKTDHQKLHQQSILETEKTLRIKALVSAIEKFANSGIDSNTRTAALDLLEKVYEDNK